MLQYILWPVLVFAGVGLIDLAIGRAEKGATMAAIAVSAIVTALYNWAFLYGALPTMTGPFWGLSWLIVPLLFCAVIHFGFNLMGDGFSYGGAVLAAIVIGFVVSGTWFGLYPNGNGQGQQLADLVTVEEAEADAYPDTDPDHIRLVSEDMARVKVSQAMATQSFEGFNVETIYDINSVDLNAVDGHLYYIVSLRFSDKKNTDEVGGAVPGFFAVDAEDPQQDPVAYFDHEFYYYDGAFWGDDIERWIWMKGYRHVDIEDLTLEVTDDWQPYYTASLNKPEIGWKGNHPTEFIIVDPNSGDIEEYDLDEVPEWVDRVWSAGVVEQRLNDWGYFQTEYPTMGWRVSGAGRLKVSDAPNLVYTSGSRDAMWQVTMTSLNSDDSASSIILMNARTGEATQYPVNNIAIEERAQSIVEGNQQVNPSSASRKEAVLPSLYNIFGTPTWVFTLQPDNSEANNNRPKTFSGVALVPAQKVQDANVVTAATMTAALADYERVLFRTDDADVTENSRRANVEGVVEFVTSAVEDGTTVYTVALEGDEHVYTIRYETARSVLESLTIEVGDEVRFGFNDRGEDDLIVSVQTVNNLSSDLVSATGS